MMENVKYLKGVGNKKETLLAKLGIRTIEDLLYFFPRDYQDRRSTKTFYDLENGETALAKGRVLMVIKNKYRYGKKQTLRILAEDTSGNADTDATSGNADTDAASGNADTDAAETGKNDYRIGHRGNDAPVMEIIFFNARYLADNIKQGEEYFFYGRAKVDEGPYTKKKIQMIHPEFSKVSKASLKGIIPVYPLTAGLSQNEMRKWQKQAAQIWQIEEFMPDEILEKNNLCPLEHALKNIHFPGSAKKDKDSQKCRTSDKDADWGMEEESEVSKNIGYERQALKEAKFRLIFDELFLLQLGLQIMKNKAASDKKGLAMKAVAQDFINSFPYSLTDAQTRVIKEIESDMERDRPMNRLIQGDVGSGKTAVAEAALYKAVRSGFQGIMMAPTELLARQHFEELKRRFKGFKNSSGRPIRVDCLTGSLTAAEKREVLSAIKSGETDIIIGTHAVIQPDVTFKNAGLVITDEQHRFGVLQRGSLAEKGRSPDIMVMTATPIPRTLAVVLFGELDVSVIDEKPAGRRDIITKSTDISKRTLVYDFVRKEVEKGRQAYVVAPLIEESESIEAKSAEEIYEELKKLMPDKTIALLHGAKKQKEKDAVMEGFVGGITDILVSTVVIEVGIDVPNASVMVIENAERFGLAQLHQLRGRVGRGESQSYCILINGMNKNQNDSSGESVASKRAGIMTESTDGFYIAEKDLELRGPGEFFGTRQHGIPDLHVADLVKHMKIFEEIKGQAEDILNKDPQLRRAPALREKVDDLFGEGMNL